MQAARREYQVAPAELASAWALAVPNPSFSQVRIVNLSADEVEEKEPWVEYWPSIGMPSPWPKERGRDPGPHFSCFAGTLNPKSLTPKP